MNLTQIGTIRSAYTEHAATPQQAALNGQERAWVEMSPEFADGLQALDEFDYIWLITWLGDEAIRDSANLREIPHLVAHLGHSVGSFATRGPFRPSPLGLHLVRLVSVDGERLEFDGVDMIDGTAVVDIKPFVKEFDRPPGDTRSGWYAMADLDRVAQRRGMLA